MIKIKKIIITLFICLISNSNVYAETIEDGLFIIVGNKAITKSDIVDEIKLILILNSMSYSDDKKNQLQKIAIKSAVNKTVKEIEIDKYEHLTYNKIDLNNELISLAERINMDVETLRNICISNELSFSSITDQIKTELLWNTLIFDLYNNKISINLEEIDERIKIAKTKKSFNEYLISEIVLKPVEKNLIEARIEEVKNMIEIDGFEKTAISLSISQTASNGGDLGWLNETQISEKFQSKIFNTQPGNLAEPIFLNEGILIFKVRDKRKTKKEINVDELKEQFIQAEKTKILNMYSMSHYDNLARTISIKYLDD